MPDSKTTVGEPSPVTWMCIRRPLTRTRRPGGGKRRRSRHTPMAWYTAPAITCRASVPRRTERIVSAVCMGYPENPRIHSSSGFLHQSLATGTHLPITRLNLATTGRW